MGMHQSGARLSERDVRDLEIASQRLAAVADQVKRANPTWAAAVVQLLIEANDVIVRLQNKGAAAFARYLEKHGIGKPQDASEIPSAGEPSNQEPIVAPGEEEA